MPARSVVISRSNGA